jgi:hypothetical protein
MSGHRAAEKELSAAYIATQSESAGKRRPIFMCGSDTHGKADRKFSTVPSEDNEKTEYDI